jgi:hypothetical protein
LYYEVTVLAHPGESFNHKYQVEAADWRQAWLTALQQTGAPPILKDVAVSFTGDMIIVGDPNSRRTMKIRTLTAEALRKSGVVVAPSPAQMAPRPAAPASEEAAKPVAFRDRASGAFRQIGTAEIQAAREQQHISAGRVLVETDTPVERESSTSPPADLASTALEDVFLEIPRMFDDRMPVEDAIDFILDLAFKHVPSEHAVLLFSSSPEDGEELHLYAAAARGPAKAGIEKTKFSIEAGIPAASLQSGITISVGDPPSDPRYVNDLRRAGVAKETSVISAPIQHLDRAFGVLLLVNRTGRGIFTEVDSNVISYIAKEMGRFIQQILDSSA